MKTVEQIQLEINRTENLIVSLTKEMINKPIDSADFRILKFRINGYLGKLEALQWVTT